MCQADKHDWTQFLLDQYEAPETKDHHGPKRIAGLLGNPADASGEEPYRNQDKDAC